jgi:hypothetical protein
MKLGDNYIDTIARDIAELCKLPRTDDGNRLARLYALLCVTVGSEVTCEHVHDAWAVWTAETNPDHKSLVPFLMLSEEVQALDEPYRNAIRDIAKPMELPT